MRHRILPLLLVGGCRVAPPGAWSVQGDLAFGEVPTGTAATRVLSISGIAGEDPAVETGAEAIRAAWVPGAGAGGRRLLVRCDPALGGAGSGTLRITGSAGTRREIPWTCTEGPRPAVLPDPALVPIGVEACASKLETGLGDARIAAGDGARLVPSPATGDLLLTDPVAGRAWRQTPWYVVPSWGGWVTVDVEDVVGWTDPPPCFEGGNWHDQDGTCTGGETLSDGTVPPGWSFHHGGFLGGDGSLDGVRAGAALPGADLLLLAGEREGAGFLAVVDAGLAPALSDEGAYAYLALVRPVAPSGGGLLPEGLEVIGAGTRGWAVDPATGDAWAVTGLDTVAPVAAPTAPLGAPVKASGPVPDGALLWVAGTLVAAGPEGFAPLPAAPSWAGLGDPDLLAGDGTRAWAWFAGHHVLAWRTLDGSGSGLLLLPEDTVVEALVADRAAGGAAEEGAFAILLASDAAGPSLRVAVAGHDVLETAGTALPAAPVALAGDPWPHDVYAAYAAGAEGCDGDLAARCDDGDHPALIHSFYLAYGLVPPTSTGHRLDLFLSPVLETPKDEDVNDDFSRNAASCGAAPEGVPEGLWDGCCALDWSTEVRVEPNLAYLAGTLAAVGAATPSPDDDVRVVLGVNPSWLRQARECLTTPETGPWGVAALEVLATHEDQGIEMASWTHTSLSEPGWEDRAGWYVDLLYETGVDWTPPIDGQDEYEMLHDGLAGVFALDDLGTVLVGGAPVDLAALAVTPLAVAGNAVDGAVLIDPIVGWPDDDPSWVRAARDGPLATGGSPFRVYWFASAGAIPEVGLHAFKKKELFPLDVRRRSEAFEMGEGPEDWYRGGDSGMVYLPGCSNALNTLGDLADSGVFRESLRWGLALGEDDWTATIRYARRILASSQADAIKTFYVHIYDISSPDGDLRSHSGVTDTRDPNVEALEALGAALVTPGYARWVGIADILAEWDAARAAR